jgi:hypothetical protein
MLGIRPHIGDAQCLKLTPTYGFQALNRQEATAYGGNSGSNLHHLRRAAHLRAGDYLYCDASRRGHCSNRVGHHYARLETELLTILPLFDFSLLLQQPDQDAHRGDALAAEIAAKSAALTRALRLGEDSPEADAVMMELKTELTALRRERTEWEKRARVVEAHRR